MRPTKLSRLRRESHWLVWLPPVLLSLFVLIGINRVVTADTPPSSNELANYLKNNELKVSDKTANGYQQIYYTYKGKQIELTAAGYNHTDPVASGEYVAWQGLSGDEAQIYLYNVLNNSLTQIDAPGVSENPAVFQGNLAWEEWVGITWQIFYYNGFTIQQISDDNVPSVRPSINGQQIIYAEQFPDYWRAISYDLSSGQRTVIKQGNEASTAYPHFAAQGQVHTGIEP